MSGQIETVSFDRAKKRRLRAAFNKAEADGREEFTFEGNPYLVAYARYLLEWLDTILPD